MTKKRLYPLYHCKKCGDFFKKGLFGFIKEGLSGQQSDVIEFVCPECKAKRKGAA